MAQQRSVSELSCCTESPGVGLTAEHDSGLEDGDDVCSDHGDRSPARSPSPRGEEDTTIFVAFKGNLDDADFQEKLDAILNEMPPMLSLGSERLAPQRVEPWNSVRVTFNIPREAAERLRLLAQNNQQQLRDLGILSVQIEGEGPINVAVGQNRGQEVRVNGPMVPPGQMRMDVGFPMQQGPGGMRMNNPAMVPPGPGMAAQGMVPGSSGQMHPRVPRPPTQTDSMDPMLSGLALQQQQQLQHPQAPHGPPNSMGPQGHHMQGMQPNRQLNPAALQQLQQQHQQQAQLAQMGGARVPFNPSNQMPGPAGWNQLPAGVPPPAQGAMGPNWRKGLPPQAQMGQRPPSLASVQTPNHPPPPYPFGSQQAGQVFNTMGQPQQQQQPAGANQFAAPQPKGLQGVAGVVGPRAPPPLPPVSAAQGSLAAKSPGSSSSPFQQGSPGTPPMIGPGQGQLGPRPTTPQGFPQGVGSPGRAVLGQQGNVQQGFISMPQHGQVPQGGMGGMPKRMPMGFPNVPVGQNFVQGQVTATGAGTPTGGAPQLQNSQGMAHPGAQPSVSAPNHMQPTSIQAAGIGHHGGMAPQPPATSGGSMGQPQASGLQTQMMGIQSQLTTQPGVSSQGQMVQVQAGGQTVLSRPMNQGQRGITPPKQMMPPQGQGMMQGQGQLSGGPGHQALLLQQQQQQQQQQDVPPTSSSNQSDNDQVQNLAMRCVSTPRVAAVKTEFPDRKDAGSFSLGQNQTQQFGQSTQQITAQTQQLANTKLATYSTTNNATLASIGVKAQNQATLPTQQPGTASSATPSSSSSASSPLLPLSQLLLSPSGLCQARGVTAPAATVTHILVPTSNVPTSSQGYPVGSVAPKSNMAAQTLVVQPLQQSSGNLGTEKVTHGTGPVPIQPKTAQSHRLPTQIPPRHPPPILPAPPSGGQTPHHPPHVPVQLVGGRQGTLGNSQPLTVAQARNCCPHQDGTATAGVPINSSNGNVVTVVAAMETNGAGVCLKSAQSALPVCAVQTNQNAVLNQSHSADGQNNPGVMSTAEESVFEQSVSAQTKPVIGSLKRKSESDVTNEMSTEASAHCCPSITDSAPPLSPAPCLDTAPEVAFSTPPTLSLSLPLPRGGVQGERAPLPQAVVKPQVLTHLIEGFVIQEGAEPFPVTGPVKDRAEGIPVNMPIAMQSKNNAPSVLKCEFCGSFAPASQFRGSKRFCSNTCAKRYNVSCSTHFRTRRVRSVGEQPPMPAVVQDGIARRRGPRRSSSEIACAKIASRHLSVKCRSESSRSEDISSCEGEEEEEDSLSLSPSSSFSCPRPAHCGPQLDDTTQGDLPLDGEHFLSASPAHWSVEEVCRFISSLQGCEDLAGQFLSQEIDGQALLLLKEEHLMTTMNIKLGPALKICASINNLRD